MLKLSEIKELIKLIDQTSVNELEIENEGSRVCIRKHRPELPAHAVTVPAYAPVSVQPHIHSTIPAAEPQAGQSAAAIDASSANLHKIVSPMVGTFYRSSSPGAASFVAAGDKVNEKTVVCIVEAMKLMNEIEAEVRGEIVEILVDNGQLVEYGQPLFLVKTE